MEHYGPLRVSQVNPRYFTDDRGEAVYLTGSHTWNNLVDMGPEEPPEAFDFAGYIAWLQALNHNFIRLWAWELVNWSTEGNREETPQVHTVHPHPWIRTGPGTALDGKPRFDLAQHNPAYFDRLRHRVQLAADNGIYISIMLFEGWGLQFSPGAYENHPFHSANNLNGIDCDTDGDGSGVDIHELGNDAILAIQESYVRRVVETLNTFDNVLYEISNENHPASTDWQVHMIRFIKDLEANLPQQHPVGMTFQFKGGSNQTLFESPADWVSPNPEGGYQDDPPAGDGSKVVLTDTDHLWGIGGNHKWVWKSFLRGLNPIFMDPYDCKVLRKSYDPAWVEPLRRSMGYTLALAERLDLIHMVPAGTVATSGYCLADEGREYLIYLPEGQAVGVDLAGQLGPYHVEWFNPNSGESTKGDPVEGGRTVSMTSPFGDDDAVLYLKTRSS